MGRLSFHPIETVVLHIVFNPHLRQGSYQDLKTRFFLFLCTALFVAIPLVRGQNQFSETVVVLKALYEDETLAFYRYREYAKKAVKENYPNTAKLFTAFALSESVHARNFRDVLSSLGAEAQEIPKPPIEVLDTKANLRIACEAELEEINNSYPQFIDKIRAENHAPAMRYIPFAWESEKQHQNLIQRILSGTGIFFRLLAKRIEEKPTDYFVCQSCGSTRTRLPPETCPICCGSPQKYRQIEVGE